MIAESTHKSLQRATASSHHVLLVVTSAVGIVLVSTIAFMAHAEHAKPNSEWHFDDVEADKPVEYVHKGVAHLPAASATIRSYTDKVPDTYDIATRAELAVNVLTCATNRNHDHEMYFSCYLGNPLRMSHNFSDWCTPKFVEALALLRPATGSDKFRFVDEKWKQVVLRSIGPDGLYYFPIQGKPWYGKELWWAKGIARADGTLFITEGRPTDKRVADLDTYAISHADFLFEEAGVKQFSHPQPCGRILNVLNIYLMQTGDSRWEAISRRMIDRLLELAIHKDDYCYFPAYYFEPNAKYDPTDARAAAPTGLQGGEINGRCIQGPALFYQFTGYEPARELAEKLTKFMRHHDDYFGANGEFIGDLHFHAHTTYLHEMLQLAMATKDQELLDFVRKSFEWAKSPQSGMSTVSGFTPEFAKPYKTSEGCAIADMIALALKLSYAGAGDYYEDAERWTRNHFAEMQLTQDKLDDLVQLGSKRASKKLLYNETTDHVGERSLGAFASWATGTEWIGGDERGSDNLIMHCCTGNATRTLYYIWRHILDVDDEVVRVNMLLNRASPVADIYSSIPYEGRVKVKLKKPCPRLLVHAPEWIDAGDKQLTANVDGQSRDLKWVGRYVDVGAFAEPAEVTIEFPIRDRKVENEQIGLERYTLQIRGNTIYSIDPPGENSPLYKGRDYSSGKATWQIVERRLSEGVVNY